MEIGNLVWKDGMGRVVIEFVEETDTEMLEIGYKDWVLLDNGEWCRLDDLD